MRNFILDNVETMWVKELSIPGTFYTSVTVRAILDHLEKDGTGLNRNEGVGLIFSLHRLWEADPRVSQFIINMEEAQKKSVRAQLPITNNMLADSPPLHALEGQHLPTRPPRLGRQTSHGTYMVGVESLLQAPPSRSGARDGCVLRPT